MEIFSTKYTISQLCLASFIFFLIKCVSYIEARVSRGFDSPYNNVDSEMDSIIDPEPIINPDQLLLNTDLDKASDVLTKILLIPWPKGESPLLYVEEPGSVPEILDFETNDVDTEDDLRPVGTKRSKYYRKYPWKRQQNNMRISELSEHDGSAFNEIHILPPSVPKRVFHKCLGKRQRIMRYEPAYMCQPNKDDVYRLLVAIHGERDGYKGQLVDFCNRKRPAALVFTNIRYVG